jgi:hypothetical protein
LELTTKARRRGIESITPKIPPKADMKNVCQKGKSFHTASIISPGITNTTEERVPAADVIVWTVTFSNGLLFFKMRKKAIEITAEGNAVEKVIPTLRPR